MAVMKNVYEEVRNGSILAAGVVKECGAAANVCKMAFGDKLGFTFEQGLDMNLSLIHILNEINISVVINCCNALIT